MLAVSPWLWAILGVLAVSGAGGAYLKGRSDGKAVIIAQQARDEKIRRDTEEAAMIGTANALAQIKVTQTTINRQVETITRERQVYVQCINGDDVVRLLDAARAGKLSGSAGDRQLPGAEARSAQVLW